MTNTTSKRKLNSKAARLSLAAIAIVGVGAAVTTAAWTDSSFLKQTASTSSFNIQASNDGVNFFESADAANPELAISTDAAFAENFNPNETRTTDIWVKNTGGEVAYVTPEISSDSALAGGSKPLTATVTAADTRETAYIGVLPGETKRLEVVASSPDWTGDEYQGITGDFIIALNAVPELPPVAQ
jgi:predicted ribosomally synthesized peptide with SipW-like signal peptide